MSQVTNCKVCGETLEEPWEPEFCCEGAEGAECGCQGLPIDPPWCGKCFCNLLHTDGCDCQKDQ